MKEIQIPVKDKIPAIKGINNSCYADSSLPILFALPIFREIILNSKSQEPVITELQKLFIDMSEDVSSIKIPEKLIQIAHLEIGKQEDATEFLNNILDFTRNALFFEIYENIDETSKNEIIQQYNSDYNLKDEQKLKNITKDNITIAMILSAIKIFETKSVDAKLLTDFMNLLNFEIKNQIKSKTQNELFSTTNESTNILGLNCTSSDSFELLYKNHFIEKDSNEHTFSYGKDGSTEQNIKTKIPSVLIMTLNRTDDQGKKISKSIKIPEEIIEGSDKYKLFAVQRHSGTATNGHYVSNLQVNMKNWTKYNSLQSNTLSPEELIKDGNLSDGDSPNLLVYVKEAEIAKLFPKTITVPLNIANQINKKNTVNVNLFQQPTIPSIQHKKEDDFIKPEDDNLKKDASKLFIQTQPIQQKENLTPKVVVLKDFIEDIIDKNIDSLDESVVKLNSQLNKVAVEINTESIGSSVKIKHNTENYYKSYLILPISDNVIVKEEDIINTITVNSKVTLDDTIDTILGQFFDNNTIPEGVSIIDRKENTKTSQTFYNITLDQLSETVINYGNEALVVNVHGDIVKYEDNSKNPPEVFDLNNENSQNYHTACIKTQEILKKFLNQGNEMKLNGKPIKFKGKSVDTSDDIEL